LARPNAILRARKTQELMLEGVTIERPETVSIAAVCEVAEDTTVGAPKPIGDRGAFVADHVAGGPHEAVPTRRR